MSKELIIIVDFGGQYNQLIARRVREANVYCEVVPYKMALAEVKEKLPKGIIFTGGPNSVYEAGAPQIEKEIFQLNIPILGICYGAQLMAQTLGGKVETQQRREYGKVMIHSKNHGVLTSMIDSENCWMSHTDQITEMPEGFTVTASSNTCPYAAMEAED
ncbi:MAG: glutamine-hydrolyzing GMP synthase, partial [Oscillospiraceae bacterium]